MTLHSLLKVSWQTHPFLSPDDEFAGYEIGDKANLNSSVLKKDSMLMLAGEYRREALKTGFKLKKRLGTNPCKFGLIGSTDTHTSLATAQQDNFLASIPVPSPVQNAPSMW